MKILLFSAFDKKGKHRSYTLAGENIEADLDVIARCLNNGWTLKSVDLVKDGHSTSLPLRAIDSKNSSQSIEAIKREWRLMISKA